MVNKYPFLLSVPINVSFVCTESWQFKLQDESKEHLIRLQVGSVDTQIFPISDNCPHFYSSNVCPLNPGRLISNTNTTRILNYCYKSKFLYQ